MVGSLFPLDHGLQHRPAQEAMPTSGEPDKEALERL